MVKTICSLGDSRYLQESHMKCEWVETSHRRFARKPETGCCAKRQIENLLQYLLGFRYQMSVTGWPFAYQHTSYTVSTFFDWHIANPGLVADAPQPFDQHTSFWVIIRHKIKTELALPSCAIKIPQVNPSDPVESK